jgi:hypothetical protein
MSPKTLECVRAEALFASDLQVSEQPSSERVRSAVMQTVRRLGPRGCAAAVAQEFGEHPDIAVPRMTWVLTAVRSVYAI